MLAHPEMKSDSLTKRFSLCRAIDSALLFAICIFPLNGLCQEETIYRSESIIQVEELNNRPEQDQEQLLKNLKARLRDWSVLRKAVKGVDEDLPNRIRSAVNAEIVEDDRFRIWLDHDDPVECYRILSALTKRVVSEGIEMGESERLAFLRAQLEEAREKLHDAERRLDDFVGKHEQYLSEEKIAGEIAGYKIGIANRRIEMEEARARKRVLQKKFRKTPEYIVTSTVVEYGPEVMKLKRTLAAEEQKLENVRSRYGEGPKTARLENRISELRLKLAVLEERSIKEEIRSPNPLYMDIEAELIEVDDLIERLEDSIEKVEERVEKNNQTMKNTTKLRIEKRRLDRHYDRASGLFEALQDKLEEEYILGTHGGGEFEVKLLVEPTNPKPKTK